MFLSAMIEEVSGVRGLEWSEMSRKGFLEKVMLELSAEECVIFS